MYNLGFVDSEMFLKGTGRFVRRVPQISTKAILLEMFYDALRSHLTPNTLTEYKENNIYVFELRPHSSQRR